MACRAAGRQHGFSTNFHGNRRSAWQREPRRSSVDARRTGLGLCLGECCLVAVSKGQQPAGVGDELVVLVDGIRRADGAGRKIVEVVAGYPVTLGNLVRVGTCVSRSSAGSPRWQVPRRTCFRQTRWWARLTGSGAGSRLGGVSWLRERCGRAVCSVGPRTQMIMFWPAVMP